MGAGALGGLCRGRGDAIARARSGLGLVRAARGEADAAADGLEQAIAELPMGGLWTRVAQALATARLIRGNTEGAASGDSLRRWEITSEAASAPKLAWSRPSLPWSRHLRAAEHPRGSRDPPPGPGWRAASPRSYVGVAC